MTDFCVNCGKRDCEMICPECNERTLTIYEQKLIAKFLQRLDYIMERIEFHTENPDSELMDEIREEYEKWELKQNDVGNIK